MKWIPVSEKPIPDQGRFLVGLNVRHLKVSGKGGIRQERDTQIVPFRAKDAVRGDVVFEYHDLLFDGNEITYPNDFGDVFSEWDREDFEFWMEVSEPEHDKRS